MVPHIVSRARPCPGAALLAALAALVALSLGCEQGREGDRCNPDLAQGETDCNSGLTCQLLPTCAINVCCPASPPYSNPECECLANPTARCVCSNDAAISALPPPPAPDAAADATAE